ncbi:MAG: hydrogenase nickel incorporation protein HypB [Geminocystis sp.]|nr:hydrogenase nickel incorporation protein HypB [Geminocystis sp.]MCS7147606.1 hydrogenase nickel incorporation protein HypB [Geminocystis sp.]MDW8115299.1 hydrogenase nickel incorporation protein HypB [Geminocystis sp.]MDW8464566.1 hydrogenase nickel incorporation protein HypB [Geminocystis sp.]
MCTDCGCSVTPQEVSINNQPVGGNNSHTLHIHQSILAKNNHIAHHNREFFREKNIYVVNILSSPGAGKTTFIQRMLTDLKNTYKTAVIVGDLATDNDSKKIAQVTNQVVQINTGDVCHLEADMVRKALKNLNLDHCQLLIIENVGNLVCPSAYDLGENERIAILSVTEGEDKPLKYPTLFKTANVVIINKIDIAQVVEFDHQLAVNNIKTIAPQAEIFMVSARTGEGMQQWYKHLQEKIQSAVAAAV